MNTFTRPDSDVNPHMGKINRMVELALRLIPGDWVEGKEVEEIITRAYETVDLNFGIQEANEWAEGFKFPAEVAWTVP